MKQINLHKRIDGFVSLGIVNADAVIANEFVKENFDARTYFFFKLDANWIDWLHTNDFFAVLNKPAEDPNRYRYETPELEYLEKVVVEKQDEVTAIMLEVDPVKNFNPEVVDRFLRIAENLSDENLAQMIEKIHKENWVVLMQKFNTWGHEYEKIIETLVKEGNIDSLILLADAIVSVRTDREEVRSNPFVLSHISSLGLFRHMLDLEGDGAVKAYKFLVKKLAEIIGESVREDVDDKVFKIDEPYFFFDTDLFTVQLNDKRTVSYRGDLDNMIAVVASLTRKIFAGKCEDEKDVLRELFDYLNQTIPDSWSGWRLRLFTASFCGDLFKGDLQAMFNRLFSVMDEGKSYYEIESGTEYKKTLKATWKDLDEAFKKQYIENIFKFFDPDRFEGERKQWTTRDALQILKMIGEYVDSDEVNRVFNKNIDDVDEPEPMIMGGHAGTVIPQTPVSIVDMSVSDIPEQLKTDLRPEVIREHYRGDPFDRPRSAEGVGEALRADVSKRLDDYLENLESFFAPNEIHSCYTYSLLWGLEEYVRAGNKFTDEQWVVFIDLVLKIVSTDLVDEDNDDRDSFLAKWEAVYQEAARILQYSLAKDFVSDECLSENQDKVLQIIRALLIDRVDVSMEMNDDLHTATLNVSHGVAFHAFVQLLYRDGEKLSEKSLALLEELIDKNTSNLTWFSVGYYLSTLYYRDQDWVRSNLPEIFNTDNKEQFFAAWEGYLSASVYKELFVEMEEYYLYALGKNVADYPERTRQRRNLDQLIGVHLALAYVHFDPIDLKHKLITSLFALANTEKQKEFISHIGRSVISSNLVKPDKKQTEKIVALWDCVLEIPVGDIDPIVFGEFGFWVSDKEDILPTKELAEKFAVTMERSGGLLDYEYHLKDKIESFAKENPTATLSILQSLLMRDDDGKGQFWVRSGAANVEVFETLYKALPEETEEFIGQLIEKHSRSFWKLKVVLEGE